MSLRVFGKKYLSKIHYDGKAKKFYELEVETMIEKAYMTKLLELLRYVPYLKDEKEKVMGASLEEQYHTTCIHIGGYILRGK